MNLPNDNIHTPQNEELKQPESMNHIEKPDSDEDHSHTPTHSDEDFDQ